MNWWGKEWNCDGISDGENTDGGRGRVAAPVAAPADGAAEGEDGGCGIYWLGQTLTAGGMNEQGKAGYLHC